MATLDQLSAALVKADAAGNAVDAKAFADEIRRMRSASPETPAAPAPTGVNAIPVEPGANTAITLDQPTSLGDKIRGAIETPFALAANALSGPVTYLAGALGPKGQKAVSNEIAYQPRTQVAQNALEGAARFLESTKLPPFIPSIAGANMLGQSLKPATRAIGDNVRAVAATDIPFGETVAQQTAAKVTKSYADAGRIEAAKAGQALGLVADPAAMNPTRGNKIASTLTGTKVIAENAAKVNETQVPIIAKREMGLPENTALNSTAPFEAARVKVSAPYNEVSAMPVLKADEGVVGQIEALRPPALIGGESSAAAANRVVDSALSALRQDVSGADVVRNVSNLRKHANDIYYSKKSGAQVSPESLATADTYMGIADALETMIENNIANNPKLLGDFRKARVAMAKTYAYENATDFNTGKINPADLAKATAANPKLTGDIATIGRFAGNFPDAMGMMTPETAAALASRTLSRAGISGTVGAGLGSVVPGVGTLAGGAIGAVAGESFGRLNASRMMSPKYQARNATPLDFRPPVNNLRPVDPNVTTNSLVPYDFANATTVPPNWTQGRPDPIVTAAGADMSRPQLAAPSAESTLAGVQQRRGFDYRMAQAMDQPPPETPRQPTGRGIQFDLDPITGKLVETSAGVKGATPEIFMADTGRNLNSAATKVASGQQFAMSAAEKAAWNNTKVSLDSIAPGFSKLSDKAVTSKMLDRQWVESAITKAKDKAAAFEALSARSNSAQAIRDAMTNREKMLDLVADLEEALSSPRPTRSGQQGPKTRASQRNRLAPESVNQLGQ